jgi:hypothetical protein
MLKRCGAAVFCLMSFVIGAAAQTTVTTSGGTTNAVPVFTGSSTVGNSVITQSDGNVGIGTTSPSVPLSIVYSNSSYGGGISLENTSTATEALVGVELLNSSGTSLGGFNYSPPNYANGTFADTMALGTTTNTTSIGIFTNASYQPGGSGNISLAVGRITSLFVQGSSGNVGIGTTSPGTKLEVDGNLKLTSGSGASITFQDGTVQSTAWTGVLCGGDYAESVDVTGDRTNYSLGDVLVIDPDHAGKFLKSAEEYSTAVMGVYSTRPGMVGRRQATPKSPEEVPMAMVGIVPARVSAENGPVRPGDLLVTSSRPGYAMKGTDRTRMLGAVIGKALGSVESGVGVIEVGVTLQ